PAAGLRDAVAIRIAAVQLHGEPAVLAVVRGAPERAKAGQVRGERRAAALGEERSVLGECVDVIRARGAVGVLDPGWTRKWCVEGLVVGAPPVNRPGGAAILRPGRPPRRGPGIR